jgi:sigma-B regulation protein RsbU (phosphoserine phosphatase)
VGACVATDQPILVNDTVSDQRFFQKVDTSSGYRTSSALTVPLRADGKVIGALQALNKIGGFSDADVELLGIVASYSGAAIQAQLLREQAEAARLLYHELEIAREVQRKLLPQELPEVPGLDYAAFCRSAKVVGGDYYDFLPLPEGMFAFAVGDVCGKGVSAAVMMASILASLRGQLLRSPLPLGELMNDLNQTIYRSSTPERYSTLFCGVLNSDRTELVFCNAAHISPIVARAAEDGQQIRIDRPRESGLPLGLFDWARYEAANMRGETWEEALIEGVVREHIQSPAGQIVDAIMQAADAFTAGAEQFDDMTVLAVRL